MFIDFLCSSHYRTVSLSTPCFPWFECPWFRSVLPDLVPVLVCERDSSWQADANGPTEGKLLATTGRQPDVFETPSKSINS